MRHGWPALLLLLAGCAAEAPAEPEGAVYLGTEARLLTDELLNIRAEMRGIEGPEAVRRYAECAAAEYTLFRGFGFARHLRTSVSEEGGIWLADAVYTISPALPDGLRTIDAEVTVADCELTGIPTV